MRKSITSTLFASTFAIVGLATAAHASPIVNFSFEDAPGTTTTDSVNSVTLNLINSSSVATDYHGAANSGVQGNGIALDFSSNASQAPAAGPLASVTNSSALGLGSVSQIAAAFWIKSDGAITANKAPRYFILGPNGTTDVNAPSAGANVFGMQNQNGTKTAVFVAGTNFQINSDSSATPSIPASTWIFFAVTYDATVANGTINLYRGDENTAPTLAGTAVANKGALDFGSAGTLMLGDNAALNRGFDGWIDNFQLMTGSLDSTAIQSIWAQAVPEPTSLFLLLPAAAFLSNRRRTKA